MNPDMKTYLQPTPTINYNDKAVADFIQENTKGVVGPREQAVRLYYAVRDGIRYDPYSIDLTVAGVRASTTLSSGRGWCVPKAILLAACCRAKGIPARLGFADVRNHLSTARMRRHMRTDIFYWHGYTSIYLDGVWLKATPAFNIELCRKFHIRPLDFDGRTDSIYHPFDLEGRRHMDYLRDRGEFADVPIDQIVATLRREYALDHTWKTADFDRDVSQEMGTNEVKDR